MEHIEKMLIRNCSLKYSLHNMSSMVDEAIQKFSSTGYVKDVFEIATNLYAVKINVRRVSKTPHTLYLGTSLKGMFQFDDVEKGNITVLCDVSGSHSSIAEDSGLLGCVCRVNWHE
jgi:hypothetical protein